MDNKEALLSKFIGCIIGSVVGVSTVLFSVQDIDSKIQYPSEVECVISENSPCKSKLAYVYMKEGD